MKYSFDKNSIEILNHLVFNAGIELADLRTQRGNNVIEFEMQRSTFENVIRKQFLFMKRNVFSGKHSRLIIHHASVLKFYDPNDGVYKNISIAEFQYDEPTQVLKLDCIPDIHFEMKVSPGFTIELTDIKDSKTNRSGLAFAGLGFTNEEWKEYLTEKNYTGVSV